MTTRKILALVSILAFLISCGNVSGSDDDSLFQQYSSSTQQSSSSVKQSSSSVYIPPQLSSSSQYIPPPQVDLYAMENGSVSVNGHNYWLANPNASAEVILLYLENNYSTDAGGPDYGFDFTWSDVASYLLSIDFSSTQINQIKTVLNTGGVIYEYTNVSGYYRYIYIEKQGDGKGLLKTGIPPH